MAAPIEQFQTTAIAFDALIVEVGRAIAKAQAEMDQARLDFLREVAQEVRARGGEDFRVPSATAYAIPETTLNLRIGLSLRTPEDGTGPVLEAVPVNAASANQVSLSATTTINLRFISVPSDQSSTVLPTSKLPLSEVVGLLGGEWQAQVDREGSTTVLDELADERLWLAVAIAAREPELLMVVDDRRGALVASIHSVARPTAAELAPVAAPALVRVTPTRGVRGQVLELEGDDLLTLAGQTTLELDGRPIPILRLSMRKLAFRVPGWATRGDLRVTTPLGSALLERGFVPLPTLASFTPTEGGFDALLQRGTQLTITGSNLRSGCELRFSTGAVGSQASFASPTRMQAMVPEGAGTGPVTLVLAQDEHRDTSRVLFHMLPRVHRVTPRQARVGASVTLLGTSLAAVSHLVIGRATVAAEAFELHTPTRIRLRVPTDAGDGQISLFVPRLSLAAEPAADTTSFEISTRDIFYVVPRITRFGQQVVVPGQLLSIQGEGFDPNPDMMTLLFDARGGISEAPVLSVANDRRGLTTRVPSDAVCGYVQLIRKNIYSGQSPQDTSDTSLSKLTVLSADGMPRDVLFEERFDDVELSSWTSEAGAWSIIAGQLACTGTGRLARPLGSNDTLVLHAEVLQAQSFGISLQLEGLRDSLQLWLRLDDAGSVLSWSELTSNGRQTVRRSVNIPQLPGGSLLLSLRVSPVSAEQTELRVGLNQRDLDTYLVARAPLLHMALLSSGSEQRWDNVIALTRDVLSLPEPGMYRFAEVPSPQSLAVPSITSFAPGMGVVGSVVRVDGQNLDAVTRAYVGGAEAVIERVETGQVTIRVPDAAATGPIELHARTEAISSVPFIVGPELAGISPSEVAPGELVYLLGRNLPTKPGDFTVEISSTPAEIVAAHSAMTTVRVPQVSGLVPVVLRYLGFELQTSVTVRKQEVAFDLIETAASAEWRTVEGVLAFGKVGEAGAGAVRSVASVVVDGQLYGAALLVDAPRPSMGRLIGVWRPSEPLTGLFELRVAGMPLLSGVAQISLLCIAGDERRVVVPPTACDGSGETSFGLIPIELTAGAELRVEIARTGGSGAGEIAILAARLLTG